MVDDSKSMDLKQARVAARALFDFDFSQPIPKRAMELAQTLFKESDRGCVLVAASLLDEVLEGLLRAACDQRPHVVTAAVDPLFKQPAAPLRSFWAKIQLAYAIRIVDGVAYAALEIIRKLRNAVAHGTGQASLTGTQVEGLVNELHQHMRLAVNAVGECAGDELEEVRSKKPDLSVPRGLDPVRLKFTFGVVFLWSMLTRGAPVTGGNDA